MYRQMDGGMPDLKERMNDAMIVEESKDTNTDSNRRVHGGGYEDGLEDLANGDAEVFGT